MATRTELKVSPVYIDEVPIITDMGRGMVGVTNTISGCQSIMPFDVFVAYVYQATQFIRDFQSKQDGRVIPIRRRRLPKH